MIIPLSPPEAANKPLQLDKILGAGSRPFLKACAGANRTRPSDVH